MRLRNVKHCPNSKRKVPEDGATMEGTIVAMVEAEVDTAEAEAEAIKDVVVEAEEDVVAIRTTVEVVAVAMEATKIEVTAVHLVVGEEAEVAEVVAVDRFGLIVGTMMTMRVTVMTVETGAGILITIAGAVAAMVAAVLEAAALTSALTSAPRLQPWQQLLVQTCR